ARVSGAVVILVVGLSLLLRPQTVSQLETRHKSQSLLAGVLATALHPTLLATWTIVVTALHANGLLDGGFREGPLFGAGVVVRVLAWLVVLVLLARLGSPERMSRYRAALGRSVGAILILVSALTFLRLALSDAPSSDTPAPRPCAAAATSCSGARGPAAAHRISAGRSGFARSACPRPARPGLRRC